MPMKILIAEDDPIAATLLALLIRQEGHGICGIVTKGAEVKSRVEETRPDVLLMDICLADDVSGLVVLREHLKDSGLPVIIISGAEGTPDMEEAIACGAMGFIQKPVAVAELRQRLNTVALRKTGSGALRSFARLRRRLFDNAAVGIYIAHPDGYYLASNETFAHMLGYAESDTLCNEVRSLDEQVYAEPGHRVALLARLEKGESLEGSEARVYGRDGDMLWIAEYLTPTRDQTGKVLHYEGVVIDITARKRAEEAAHLAYSMLRATMDALSHYVVLTDLDGNVIMGNKAFEKELAPECAPDRLLHFRTAPSGRRIFSEFLADIDADAPFPQTSGLLALEGNPHALRTSITRYCTQQGAIIGAVFVMEPPL